MARFTQRRARSAGSEVRACRRRLAGCRMAAGVLLAAGALCGAAAPVATAAPTTPISAVNGWSLHGLSPSDLDAQLALMASQGVRELRVDASWTTGEPTSPGSGAPVYHWGTFDSEVAEMASHDIRWLPILDYSTTWSGTSPGDWRSPPTSAAQFAAYAAAITARYGAGGTFWAQNPQLPYLPVQIYEIWNEENGNYYWDAGPNPAQYARLYLAARSAIHAVDANAQVMIGGLTNPQQGMSALQFLNDMFTDVPALLGNVDAVGLHPYAATASGTVNFVVQVRDLLDSLGEGSVPIAATEFGWQYGDGSQEQSRAVNMSAVAAELGNSNCGVELVAPYDWEDPSYITGGDWGLAGSGGVRAAGTAWFSALASAATGPPNNLCPPVPPGSWPTTGGGTGTGSQAGGGTSTSGSASPAPGSSQTSAPAPVSAPTPAPAARPSTSRAAASSASHAAAKPASAKATTAKARAARAVTAKAKAKAKAKKAKKKPAKKKLKRHSAKKQRTRRR